MLNWFSWIYDYYVAHAAAFALLGQAAWQLLNKNYVGGLTTLVQALIALGLIAQVQAMNAALKQ